MTNVADERQQHEGVREHAASTAQGAAAAAQDKAVQLRSRSADQVRQQLDTRTTDAGRQARNVAQALRQSGENLRGQGNSQAAGFTEGAAGTIERLGDYLERVDGDELLRDVEQFARRRPWLLAGISAVVGMATSRMLKASSERRYDSQSGSASARGAYEPYEPATSYETAVDRPVVPESTPADFGAAGERP